MRKAQRQAVVEALFRRDAESGKNRICSKRGDKMDIRLPEDTGIDVNRLAVLFRNMEIMCLIPEKLSLIILCPGLI